MRSAALVLFVTAVGMSSVPANAAGIETALLQHMAKGVPEAKVGDWVTYQLKGGARAGYMRLAVVGEEKDEKGRDAHWIELEIADHHAMKSPIVQLRMLAAKGEGLGKDAVTRMYWGGPFGPPQELSPPALAAALEDKKVAPRGPAEKGKPLPKNADVKLSSGQETRLMTLAGTVAAVPMEVRYRSTVLQRIWMSRQIPVLQLAKLEMPAIHHAMEVRDYGRDAKPLMRLPPKDAPKVELHSVEENFPFGKLDSAPEVPE